MAEAVWTWTNVLRRPNTSAHMTCSSRVGLTYTTCLAPLSSENLQLPHVDHEPGAKTRLQPRSLLFTFIRKGFLPLAQNFSCVLVTAHGNLFR